MGIFSILLAGYLFFVAICYWLCPKCIIEKKTEYVSFWLLFLSFYTLMNGIVTLILARCFSTPMAEANLYYGITFIPFLFMAHLIYPFRKTKRNQHLSFFLFFASLLIVGTVLLTYVIARMMNRS
ncbi:MAG: hypothetical protein LBD53_06645 [Tannerella sp.]|nr:hypothetical protein [Tannerella sp.]